MQHYVGIMQKCNLGKMKNWQKRFSINSAVDKPESGTMRLHFKIGPGGGSRPTP
jgi:hypothetical protein